MSDVRSLRRLPLLRSLALLLLVIVSGCAREAPIGDGVKLTLRGDPKSPCAAKGRNSNYAPIICIDDSTANLTIDPATDVHVVNHSKGNQPNVVNWFTTSGTHTIQLTDKTGSSLDTCFSNIRCDGSHCIGVTNHNARQGDQCKYTVSLVGYGTPIDPIIIIDDCCPPPSNLNY